MGRGEGLARRNSCLFLVYSIGQNAPLYWPYMFHLVTVTRGLSASEFGVLKAIYYASTVAMEIPFGAVADRFGRRIALVMSAIATVVGCTAYALATDFPTFALAELLLAVSNALHSGASTALLYDSLATEGQAADFSKLYGRAYAGAALTMVVGLPLADRWLVRAGDPSRTYMATALIALVGGLAAFAMREPPAVLRRSTVDITRVAIRAIAHDRGLLRLILYGTGLYVLYRAGNAAYYDPILAWKRIPVDRFGQLFAAVSLCQAFTAWRAHAWGTRIGPAVLISMPVALISMYGGLLVVPGQASASFFLVGGAVGGLLPVLLNDLVNRRNPDSSVRATVLSLQSLSWRGSYALVALWIGWTLDVLPITWAITAGVLLSAVPLAVQLAMRGGGEASLLTK
jgi:MFS family permease